MLQQDKPYNMQRPGPSARPAPSKDLPHKAFGHNPLDSDDHRDLVEDLVSTDPTWATFVILMLIQLAEACVEALGVAYLLLDVARNHSPSSGTLPLLNCCGLLPFIVNAIYEADPAARKRWLTRGLALVYVGIYISVVGERADAGYSFLQLISPLAISVTW